MEVIPHYQSIHVLDDKGSSRIFGWEALLRGPQGSPLESPIAFFKEARNRGRLAEIDYQAFRQSCRVFAAHDPGGKLFVNIFPETLCSDIFNKEDVYLFLHEIGLAPSRIVVELVEGSRILDIESIHRKLQGMTADRGVSIALDDYGTGFADLEKWLWLSPEYIKIPRSIVSGIHESPRRQEAVKAIVAMSKGDNTLIVAEGVERSEDADWVYETIGAHLGQGFLFSHPSVLPLNGQSKEVISGHEDERECANMAFN